MAYKGELPATFYGTVSTLVDHGPGVIYWIVVQPSSKDSELRVRDGGDTGAETILRFSREVEATLLFRFDPPQPYRKGLFVEKVDDIISFTVCYDHLDEAE